MSVTFWNLENPILRNKNPARLRLATIKGEEPHPLPERSESSSVLLHTGLNLHYVKPFYMLITSIKYQSLEYSQCFIYLLFFCLSLFFNLEKLYIKKQKPSSASPRNPKGRPFKHTFILYNFYFMYFICHSPTPCKSAARTAAFFYTRDISSTM